MLAQLVYTQLPILYKPQSKVILCRLLYSTLFNMLFLVNKTTVSLGIFQCIHTVFLPHIVISLQLMHAESHLKITISFLSVTKASCFIVDFIEEENRRLFQQAVAIMTQTGFL